MSAVTVCPPRTRWHHVGAGTANAHYQSMKVMTDKMLECGALVIDQEDGYEWVIEDRAPAGLISAWRLGRSFGAANGLDGGYWQHTIVSIAGERVYADPPSIPATEGVKAAKNRQKARA